MHSFNQRGFLHRDKYVTGKSFERDGWDLDLTSTRILSAKVGVGLSGGAAARTRMTFRKEWL